MKYAILILTLIGQTTFAEVEKGLNCHTVQTPTQGKVDYCILGQAVMFVKKDTLNFEPLGVFTIPSPTPAVSTTKNKGEK